MTTTEASVKPGTAPAAQGPPGPWPSEWLRGVLELAVLRAMADGPTYGYAVAATLERAGFGSLKGGTLYPLLGRLEQAGHVHTQWQAGEGGPGRKYYQLTEAGHRLVEHNSATWTTFAAAVTRFLAPPDAFPEPLPEKSAH
jgi:PadR family transcriptional regulator PadR